MSVGFYWAPCAEKRRIPVGTSTEYEALTNVFGKAPWKFSNAHLDRLEAMAVVAGQNSLFAHIADAVRQHDEIEVTAEW